MSKVAVLKIDKDCYVGQSWIRGYVNVIKTVCKTKNTKVTSIEMCQSKKGLHF